MLFIHQTICPTLQNINTTKKKLKDIYIRYVTLTRFASIQSIPDSVEYFENYEVILAKFSILVSLCYFLANCLLCSYSVNWER